MFDKLEKIERVLYTSGNLNMKTVIITGSKGAEDRRLSGCYQRTYESKKYSNVSELSSVQIKTGDYFVISWSGRQDDGKYINEEVYLSYPHITLLKDWIREAAKAIMNGEIFEDGEIIKDDIFVSPIFISNKKLAIQPAILEREEGNTEGVVFIVSFQDAKYGEDLYVTMDLNGFMTIYEIIEDMNFIMLIQMTLMMGMLCDRGNGGSSSASARFNATNNSGGYQRRYNTSTHSNSDNNTTTTTKVSSSSDRSSPSFAGRRVIPKKKKEEDEAKEETVMSLDDIMNESGKVDATDLNDEDLNF